ncbi:MAG TPA: hypothetical protein VF653_12900 [Methylomirabilota bacterium]
MNRLARLRPMTWTFPPIVFGILMLLMLPTPARAVGPARHSGTVVAVDTARGVLALEELGPWTGSLDTTVVRREVRLDPMAEATLVTRDPDGTGSNGWRGGFTETPIALSELRAGDYVTIETIRQDGGLVAGSIEVLRPSARS